MAALEPAFGEEAMADVNHSLVRENLAATDCSEFHFNANCSTGQGQLCILEPHITEIVDNEGFTIDQLTTAENIALEDSAKTEAVWEYPWQSDKVVTKLSVPHQDKNTSVEDQEANTQSSKPLNYYNTQTKNRYFSDRPKKDFQQPSLFAQHKNVFCASKVPMQREQFQICNSLVPNQNSQAKNGLIIGDQCGENNQSLSHPQYYKSALPNENSAWQHQNSQSEAGSLRSEACYGSTLVPVPLEAENIIEYIDEAVGPNAIQVTDQRTETKNLHICDQCGREYQWLSERIEHQLLCFGGEADRQGQLHLEGRNASHLEHVPILFQENSMCATSWETSQPKSRDHNTHAKMQYLCLRSEKDFCRSTVLKWHTLPREELTRQSESKINKSSTLSFVPQVGGNMFADSCETSNLNSMLTSFYAGKDNDQCGKDFRWSSALAQHQAVHSGKDSKKPCPSKVDDQKDLPPGLMNFDQPSHLNTNQLTEKNKPYPCGHCGKSFKWPSDLARHKHVHSRKKLMRSKGTKPNKSCICDQCGKLFYWPSHLAQHKRTHSRSKLMRGTKFKFYICGHCGKSYHWPSRLTRHEQTHFRTKLMKGKCSQVKKSYICVQCGNNFQWPELAQHKCMHSRKKLLRAKGTKLNKSCICDQCGKGFKWPSDLARHEHTHSRKKILRGKCTKLKKNYTCSQCRKTFQEASQLAEHEHTHSRSKLVSGKRNKLNKSCICDQCGKGFTWPSDLARHEHTHSRKKKY